MSTGQKETVQPATHLFKYVTAETGSMVLKNGTLRWSTPARLNDPFDMQFAFQLPANMAVVRAKTLEKLYRHFWGGRSKQPFAEGVLGTIARGSLPPKPRDHFAEEIGPALDKTIENFINARGQFNDLLVNQQCYNARILCLSEVCTSIVMWSYYAANHSGIVLGFSSHKAESPFRLAHPVKYVAQMPNLYDEETLSDMLAGYVELNPADFVGDVVWTKSLHWSHELEWRIYSDESNKIAPYEDIPFSPDDLRSVIFGVRIMISDGDDFDMLIFTGSDDGGVVVRLVRKSGLLVVPAEIGEWVDLQGAAIETRAIRQGQSSS